MDMNSKVTVGGIEFTLTADNNNNFKFELSTYSPNPEVDVIRISFSSENPEIPPEFTLNWRFPIVNIVGVWEPRAHKNKNLNPDWCPPFSSELAVGAPVFSLFDGNSNNRLTCAVSDALNYLEFSKGVNEESAFLKCGIRFMKNQQSKLTHYTAEIRLDQRNIHYSKALRECSLWWRNYYPLPPTPQEAYSPVYSSWYTFHQNLQDSTLEEQCEIARQFGCEVVIVDDGWQTDDNNRGYAFCGDWELSKKRFPDMAKHVEKVHAMGLKYMVWYSVPFVGIKSKAFQHFSGKYLYMNDELAAAILDPRFPDVREYLINIYVQAMTEWKLDGFKLDFIDSFSLPRGVIDPALKNPGDRDILTLPETVNRLMLDIRHALSSINPEVLIEFRQLYIGPAMLQYGNMFRATDCPNDYISNRIRTIDVRLLAPNCATHADMLMWNPAEPVELAARQLLNVFFAVPQISVDLKRFPQDHLEMVKFLLDYQQRHKDVFLHGSFSPESPELNYPVVYASSSTKAAIGVYQNNLIISADTNQKKMLIVLNGSGADELALRFENATAELEMRIYDACGKNINFRKCKFTSGVHLLTVPVSGILELEVIS